MNQVNSTKLVQFHSKQKNIIGISHRDEIKNLPRQTQDEIFFKKEL